MVLAPYYEIVESWAGLQAAIKVPLRKLNDDMHIYLHYYYIQRIIAVVALRCGMTVGFYLLKLCLITRSGVAKKYQKIDHGMEK